jgi:hypothetical protein
MCSALFQQQDTMNNPIRHFWFQHYWWITAVIFLIAARIVAVRLDGEKEAATVIATLAGVAVGVVYFVQKQRLEEVIETIHCFQQAL